MIQKKVTDFFALEGNYPDLDGEGAAARLSAAIRCKTINYFDHSRTDYTEFDKLHAHIKASYPNIMRVGTFERIGHHAVLITIPGSDASLRPCLYMSHQDVVPVVEGTEQDWTHPAFSGDIADGYIWGRGTLDIKEQVFGVLEAAEYLLAHGKSFARTAYLAFGDDEETINLGALAIAEHLKAQGVTLEFVLDEGGCKIEPGTAFGAPETAIGSVQLMEKGYVSGRVRIGIQFYENSIAHEEAKAKGQTLPEALNGIGVQVISISEDSDLRNTIMKPNDWILSMNGKEISDYDSINEAIAGLSAGDSVHCRCATVQENGKLKTYEIDFRLLEDQSGEY